MKYLVIFFSLLLIALPITAEEAPPGVMQVLVIDTNGDNDKYLELYDKITAVYKKHGSTGERSLWVGTFAGTSAGEVVLTIEYPSLESLAASNSKLFPTEDYQAVIAEFNDAGMSATSNSLFVNQR